MNRPAWLCVFIAYFLTWSTTICFFLLYKNGTITLDQLNLLYNVGALGPAAGAFFAAGIFYGKAGLQKLLASFSFRRMTRTSWLLSLSPLLFFFIGLLLYPLMSGHWFTFADTQRQFHLSMPLSYLGWVLPFVTYSFLEEFGWRGFLLPHLQEKYSAYKSTFLLTVFWACWHLPFFLWRFQFSPFMIFGFFFSIFIGALIITSTYNSSRGSIVSVILFHLANNITSALDKEYIVIVTSVAFVLLAIYIVRVYKPENLSKLPRIKNYFLE